MRGTIPALRAVKASLPSTPMKRFEFPALSTISAQDLPNNGFGVSNYYIPKTKYGQWPVYKKVCNTKITTEIKNIQGDIRQFKSDLVKHIGQVQPKNVVLNQTAGHVEIKGDVVELIKKIFDEKL